MNKTDSSTRDPETLNIAPHIEFTIAELRDAFNGIGNNKKPGIDEITKEIYATDLENGLVELQRQLRDGTYAPLPVLRKLVRKPGGGRRPIAYVCTVDKIVQRALLHRIEPRLKGIFFDRSFARAGWGPVVAADQLFIDLMRIRPREVVSLDIKKFYENIDHERLLKMLRQYVSPAELVLIKPMIMCSVVAADPDAHSSAETVDDEAVAEPTMTESVRTIGVEQGMPISMFLANMFLHYALDVWLDGRGDVAAWARFLDDVRICLSPTDDLISEDVLDVVAARLDAFGLKLNPGKTSVVTSFDPEHVNAMEAGDINHFFGVDFVGVRLRPMRMKSGGYYVNTFTNAASDGEADE